MKWWLKLLLPWFLVALFIVEMAAVIRPRAEKGLRLQDFGRLPVVLGGRVQPFDSVGRNALLQIRGTGDVPLEEKKFYVFWKHPKKLRGYEWVAEVMLKPELADTRPLFLIHHPDLLNEFALRGKGVEKSGLFYFAFNELTNVIDEIEKAGRDAMNVEAEQRNAYQKQAAKLHNALSLYRRIKNSYQPEGATNFAAQLAAYEKSVPAGIAAVKAREAEQKFDQDAFNAFLGPLTQFDFMARFSYPLIVPPAVDSGTKDDWRNMGQMLFQHGVQGAPLHDSVRWYAAMATAYQQNDAAGFNKALDEYRAWLEQHLPKEARKGRAEFFFNQLQPFLHSMVTYMLCFVVAAFSMLLIGVAPEAADVFRRMAANGTAAALVLHTIGLIFRMVLEGRPPVTNLYSSAIFIGWMSVVLGLVLERFYKVGIGVVAGCLAGFASLVVAQNLALSGDTMEMLRAVLDTNFWLATHVVTITLGYAANFVAGMLAILYIVLGLFTPLLAMRLRNGRPVSAGSTDGEGVDIGQALTRMVYGIICFAMLFSFVGTVLGGIWADQSWGRFWGWDPKENGALIIVLWNAVMLHARWGGLVRERGLMNLAIFGNIVTSFSWFGTNMLGIGLHSYGFMDAAFVALMAFIGSQILFIAMGSLPDKLWRSYRNRARWSSIHPASTDGGHALDA